MSDDLAIVFLSFSALQMKKTHQTPSCVDALKKLEKIYVTLPGTVKWVSEQLKKIEADIADQRSYEELGKVIEATVNAWEKFESGSEVDVVEGVLDIISILAVLSNHPAEPAIKALRSVIGSILTYHKPEQPSVVQQLAAIVHGELVNLNKKLQDQKFDGLKRRVTDQVDQLCCLLYTSPSPRDA